MPFTRNKAANGVNNSNILSKIPLVICPGSGNSQIDYLNPLSKGDEYGFVSALVCRGCDSNLVQVLPLGQYEYVRVAGGLSDIPNFYTGNCRPEVTKAAKKQSRKCTRRQREDRKSY